MPENKLVFKQSSLKTAKTAIPSTVLSKKQLLSPADLKQTLSSKNLLQKRSQIRKFFDAKETFPRHFPEKKKLFQVIGRSESTDKIKNSTRLRKSFSQTKISFSTKSLPLRSLVKPVTPSNLVVDLNVIKKTRKIVPIEMPLNDLTDFDDFDDSLVIRPRYF